MHKPQTEPFTAALSSLRGQPKRLGANSVKSMHKLMFHKDLALACRLTTTAADKASLFTVFGAEVREEEEEEEDREQGREGCGFQLALLQGEKNDQEKWDHNGAHRNLSLRPQNTERSFSMSYNRIQAEFI